MQIYGVNLDQPAQGSGTQSNIPASWRAVMREGDDSETLAEHINDAGGVSALTDLNVATKRKLLDYLLKDSAKGELDEGDTVDALVALAQSCSSKAEYEAVFGSSIGRLGGMEADDLARFNAVVEGIAAGPALPEDLAGGAVHQGQIDKLLGYAKMLNDPAVSESVKASIRAKLGSQSDIEAAMTELRKQRDVIQRDPTKIDSQSEIDGIKATLTTVASALESLDQAVQLDPNANGAVPPGASSSSGANSSGSSGPSFKGSDADKLTLAAFRRGEYDASEIDEKTMALINSGMQRENQAFQMLQTAIQMNTQQASTMSNLSKAAHDAAMVFINNLRA